MTIYDELRKYTIEKDNKNIEKIKVPYSNNMKYLELTTNDDRKILTSLPLKNLPNRVSTDVYECIEFNKSNIPMKTQVNFFLQDFVDFNIIYKDETSNNEKKENKNKKVETMTIYDEIKEYLEEGLEGNIEKIKISYSTDMKYLEMIEEFDDKKILLLPIKKNKSEDGITTFTGIAYDEVGMEQEVEINLNSYVFLDFNIIYKDKLEENSKKEVQEKDTTISDNRNRVKEIIKHFNVMLIGNAGSGKTELALEIAREQFNNNYELITMSGYKLPEDITGFTNLEGKHIHKTNLRHIVETGGLLIIDEVSNSDNSTLVSLNSLLSNGVIYFGKEEIKAHKDFRVIACGNSLTRSSVYSSAVDLDKSFIDRFYVDLNKIYYKYVEGKEEDNRIKAINNFIKFANLKDVSNRQIDRALKLHTSGLIEEAFLSLIDPLDDNYETLIILAKNESSIIKIM